MALERLDSEAKFMKLRMQTLSLRCAVVRRNDTNLRSELTAPHCVL